MTAPDVSLPPDDDASLSTAVSLPPRRRAPTFVADLALGQVWSALPRVSRIAHGRRAYKGAERPTYGEQVAAFRELVKLAFQASTTVPRTDVRKRIEDTTRCITSWGRAHGISVAAMQDLFSRLTEIWR